MFLCSLFFTPCAFSWQEAQSFVLSTHSIAPIILPNKSPQPHMALWSYHELCEPQSVSSVLPSVQRTSHFLLSHNQLHTISSQEFCHSVLISFCKTELFCFFCLFFPFPPVFLPIIFHSSLLQKTCFSTHSSNKETLLSPCFHTFTGICSVCCTLLFRWLSKHPELLKCLIS